MKTTEIITELNGEIKYLSKQVAENKAVLAENFTRYFPEVGESIYKQELRMNLIASVIKTLTGEASEGAIEAHIQMYTAFVMRAYNVRTRSTSELNCTVSTWQIEVKLELIEYLTKLVN